MSPTKLSLAGIDLPNPSSRKFWSKKIEESCKKNYSAEIKQYFLSNLTVGHRTRITEANHPFLQSSSLLLFLIYACSVLSNMIILARLDCELCFHIINKRHNGRQMSSLYFWLILHSISAVAEEVF